MPLLFCRQIKLGEKRRGERKVMTFNKASMGKAVVALFLLLMALDGSASAGSVREAVVKTVTVGSTAEVRFLCRLKTGEVVAATDRAVGQDPSVQKSPVFLLKDKDGPVSVIAAASLLHEGKELSFEDEILNRLAVSVVGMKQGERRTVELTAKDVPERTEFDYVVSVARIRERPKEMHIPFVEYRARTGKSPKKGQPFIFDPSIPGSIESITKDDVVIRFSARPGDVVQTPFGPGHIRETEKTYEIVINAKKGTLVRSGGFVGRISVVDEKSITIDYRNPFGGETLACDVTVEKVVAPKAPATEEAGK